MLVSLHIFKRKFDSMNGKAVVGIVAIGFLSALTTLSDLHGQERFKDLEEEYFHRVPQYTIPNPEYPRGAQVDAHEGDSLALVAFYNSTGGPSTWLNRSGWLQEPVSDWHGIRMDSSGRVTVIDLELNNLFGTLPSDLWQLTKLEYLDLGYWTGLTTDNMNRLSGTLPPISGICLNFGTWTWMPAA